MRISWTVPINGNFVSRLTLSREERVLMMHRMLWHLDLPSFGLDYISYLPDPYHIDLSCSNSLRLTLDDCYVVSEVPLLVFNSLDLKGIVIPRSKACGLLRLGFCCSRHFAYLAPQ